MRTCKVFFEYEGKVSEEIVETVYYSESYIIIEKKYPGCIVKNISEIL
jgi:hypothetical protein